MSIQSRSERIGTLLSKLRFQRATEAFHIKIDNREADWSCSSKLCLRSVTRGGLTNVGVCSGVIERVVVHVDER